MPYNEQLAGWLRDALAEVPNVEEKKMFRGITFMVNGKMCISVSGMERIMCRIDPAMHDTVIEKNGCREVVMRGRVIKSFVYVYEEGIKTKKELAYWIKLALDFNKIAKSSKKRNK